MPAAASAWRLSTDRVRKVQIHLLRFAGRDERGTRDQAGVTLRELRSLLDVAEENVLGELHELRRELAEGLAERAGKILAAHGSISFSTVFVAEAAATSAAMVPSTA